MMKDNQQLLNKFNSKKSNSIKFPPINNKNEMFSIDESDQNIEE